MPHAHENPTPTIAELLAEADARLREAGVDSPRLSAQILAAHALGCDRVRLVVDARRVLGAGEAARVRELVARRAAGEPVAYILGEKEFYGLDFAVSPAVLVPRPETEHLIEEAERRLGRDAAIRFADLGTGSGCIAVTLAVRFGGARGLALDRSAAALDVARANARRHGVDGRLQFLRGDMGGVWARPGSLDLVVSNPPYVSEAEYRTVSFEVADYEPRSALVPDVGGAPWKGCAEAQGGAAAKGRGEALGGAPGEDVGDARGRALAQSATGASRSVSGAAPGGAGGADGLECYRVLVPRAAEALRPGGLLLLEIGWDQGRSVPAVIDADGRFEAVEVLPDLAGRDRVVAAVRR